MATVTNDHSKPLIKSFCPLKCDNCWTEQVISDSTTFQRCQISDLDIVIEMPMLMNQCTQLHRVQLCGRMNENPV